MKAVFAGWAVVIWTVATRPAWLVGRGSLLAALLPGSQGFPGYEGIEAVLFLGTLPVLIELIRMEYPA